jgi:hypothetical protein
MSSKYKIIIKDWLPPALIRRIRRGKNTSFIGKFASWDEAKKYSDG